MILAFITNSLWEEPHRGRHHFASLLSQKHTVIWVNRSLAPGEAVRQPGLEHIHQGLYVLHCGRGLLTPRLDHRLNLNNLLRRSLLEKSLKQLGGRQAPDILWNYDYKALPFVKKYMGQAATLYFCNDYFGEKVYQRYESRLAPAVDHVFCTAPKLQERLAKYNSRAYFLPHGFWPRQKPARFQKTDYSSSLTAGYVGTLREVIDVEFLQRLLEQTNLSLTLGGPMIEASPSKKKELEPLLQHKRVRYLGNLTPVEAEKVIDSLDIALLPYVETFKTRHNFVIKYFDYLAAGKPMVATSYFEWPEPYDRFVAVNQGGDLQETLTELDNCWNQERFQAAQALAAKSTWHERVKEVGDIIGKKL